MRERTSNTWRLPVAVFVRIGLIGLGSLATYLVMREQMPERPAVSEAPANPPAPAPASVRDATSSAEPLRDLTLILSKEAIDRAGIVISRVTAATNGGSLRVPAIVKPNSYRSVVVTPIVGGRVTSVSAQLGQHVRRGQSLAQVYSAELAETQSQYLAARAELDAHERELRRTEKLVELGSASRQELEQLHAEHTGALAMVQSLRSKLTLLGLPQTQVEQLTSTPAISATVTVSAPIEGVITEREVNVGQNVDTAAKLFTVVDLSTVWLVGSVYERDLGRVRTGSPVTITTHAYPTMSLQGTVSYLDAQLNPDRTAQVRAEIPNQGSLLRLGMYADMQIGGATSAARVMIPRAAVQMIGDRSVVYLSDSTTGAFIEREVRLGAATDDQVEIVSGLRPGDSVVVKGSFALRAERERLGLRTPLPVRAPVNIATARIMVSEKGFEPERVTLRVGIPARLTFVRTTDATCATEVAVPSLKITRALPLNQPVDIEFTPEKPGDIAFACGMGMLSGTLVIVR